MREVLRVPMYGPFPVLMALEKVPFVFSNCDYEIVDDDELPPNTMAQCVLNDKHGFNIQVKNSVYLSAYENNGACLGFICHEICHVFLFELGYTPVITRCFPDKALPAFCSVEWQAKALCAEVMIPYDESMGMTAKEIIERYSVSQAFAAKRLALDTKVQ